MQSITLESRVGAVIPLAWGTEATEAALAAAQAICGEAENFDAILVGAGDDTGILETLARGGARNVYRVYTGASSCSAPEAVAFCVGRVLAGTDADTNDRLILTPPGPEGEELSASLAFHLRAQSVGRCQEIGLTEFGVKAERSVWGGRKRMTLEVASGLVVACLRAGKPQLSAAATEPSVHKVEMAIEPSAMPEVEIETTGESMPPVESCKLVVSGGRGVNEQGFELLEQIARKAEGTLGGSLPAVDAGIVPVVRQVGISGKFVTPELYFAVGISGTPQHLAGISPDTRIVAINKDPEAAIFSVAEAGVVGEWQELLPAVLRALEA